MKMIKRITVLSFILLCVIIGCGSWEKTSAITYKSIGIALENTRIAAKDLCDTGVLNTEECENLKTQYNVARENYRMLGDLLVSAIELETAINEKEYDALIQTVSSILNGINLVIERNR